MSWNYLKWYINYGAVNNWFQYDLSSNLIKYAQYLDLIQESTRVHISQGHREGDLIIERRTDESPSSGAWIYGRFASLFDRFYYLRFFFWHVSKSSALQMNMTSIDIFIIIENNDSNNFKSEW